MRRFKPILVFPRLFLSELKGRKRWHTDGRTQSKIGRARPILRHTIDDDDDDEGRINFSVALSPKTTRTRNNKPKQWSHVIVVNAMRRCFYMIVRPNKKFGFQSAVENLQRRRRPDWLRQTVPDWCSSRWKGAVANGRTHSAWNDQWCVARRADKTDSWYPLMTQSTRSRQLDSMRWHACVKD